MFNIGDRGFLNAEYFGYDRLVSYRYPLGIADAKLVMAGTKAEISTQFVETNPKTGTMYCGIKMPAVEAYNCEINGWIGGSTDTRCERLT